MLIFALILLFGTEVCGRGGGSNSHPGNESFRDLVNDVKVLYVSCPKREKPLIARRIVEAVREQTPPGRFLIKDITGLWNDIGDGRAREKTSQALREGAPIIRCMVRGGPTESTDNMDVATIVKEAKKEERANKELCADMPQSNGDVNHMSEHIHHTKMEPPIIKCEYGSQGPVMMHMPNVMTADSQPTVWPHAPPQPRRMFNNIGMPYPQPYPHYAGHVMRGFVGPAPPPVPIDYGNHANRPPPRCPDSVPHEIVRRLLLGQIDPVTLAVQMLSPQEAAFVARRHANSNVLVKPEPGVNNTPTIHTQHPPMEMVHTLHPPIISVNNAGSSLDSSPPRNVSCESSSRSSSGECFMRQSPSEETSSVASSSRQSTIETPTKRALPKKKRKYIEESSDWDV
jgi:hypothetical protein